MKISEITCRKCGANAMEAAKRGAYLSRVSPKGNKPIIMECRPNCGTSGNNEDAIIRAIKGEGE